ncbi:hypothetical protein [Sulfitobacter sp. 1A15299]|uniref:hypothetical protein n=1 Tax=Sulfitobacter sp. 1A15299 TaxID=3368598 RepID=UPI003745D20B
MAKKNHKNSESCGIGGTLARRPALGRELTVKDTTMRSIIYLIGLIVVVLAILRFAFGVI